MIEVIDDGDGMPADVTESGLKQFSDPALPKPVVIAPAPGGGTRLACTAPPVHADRAKIHAIGRR